MKYFYEIYDTCGDDTFVKYFQNTESVEDFVRNKVNELQANVEEYMKDFEIFRDNETTLDGVSFTFLGYVVERIWFDD